MNIIHDGSPTRTITKNELNAHLDVFIQQNKQAKKVLLLPPDITRLNSRAGEITAYLYQAFKDTAVVNIMPALGTHVPMKEKECLRMFGSGIPYEKFLPHRWKEDLIPLGELNGDFIAELSEGKLQYTMQVAINKELIDGGYDLIVSIGQVVPHEVIGMANYTKNILVGVGGTDTINKSHFLGAVYGMERIMGETDTPVRRALNAGYDQFVREKTNIEFVLTVIGKEANELCMRGLYIGNEDETFSKACELSRQVNLDHLKKPIQKCVVYLDPEEFKSTWLGNKAIYRTRKAMANDGELIILAPALETFGEDKEIDRLIRKYGYRGTEKTLKAVEDNEELSNNLSAAAHLIHGSSDGRFHITYAPGQGITKDEIQAVGYHHTKLSDIVKKYDPMKLRDGWNDVGNEEIFFISNPALGLWQADLNH